MSIGLMSIDAAIRARLQAGVPVLRRVTPLNHEGDLDKDGDTGPCAFTLLRGARMTEPRAFGDDQPGPLDVMVWLRATNVAQAEGAASTQAGSGAYALIDAAIAALNGFVPVQDHPLRISEFGLYRMRSSFEVTAALRFQLTVTVPFNRQV